MVVKKRLGEMLREAGVIDEAQLQAALGHQRKWGGKLGQALLDLKLVTEPQIVSALSRKFGYEAVNVGAMKPSPQLDAALKLVPRELASRQILLPISSDASSLTVAMADPSNIAVIDELSFRTGRRIRIVIAGDREIARAVRRFYFAEEDQPVMEIPLEEVSGSRPMEVTNDPFAAMPDYMREGFLQRGAMLPNRAVASGPSMTALQPVTAPTSAARATALPQPNSAGLAPISLDGPVEGPQEGPGLRRTSLFELLGQMARSEDTGVRPGQLAAALGRVLLKRGLVSEAELFEELARRS